MIKKYSDLYNAKTVHIFEYFDHPLFFISKMTNGELYLNYYIDEIEDNVDKWLFGRVTNKERKDLVEQRISVLQILNPLLKQRRLYHLIVDSNTSDLDNDLNIELISSSNFDPQSFPEEDFYVKFDYSSNQALVKVEDDILDSSRFKIILKDEKNSHDIGLDMFLNLLNNFKKTLNDFAKDVGDKFIGNVSSNIINLRIDSLQPSSFGVWLKTEPDEVDLFEVPEKSLNNLFEIIEDLKTKDQIEIEEKIEIDKTYSIDSIKSLKNMLKDMSDNEFTFELMADTKYRVEPRVTSFKKDSYSKLDLLTNILRDKSERIIEEIKVEGTLISINLNYNSFRILTADNGEIHGRMSTQIFKSMKARKHIPFRVPSIIEAVITKEVINDLVNDEYSEKYVMTEFTQPED
jgi:hypothetical protein